MLEHPGLKNLRVAIVKHAYTGAGGLEQELLDYLNPRVAGVLYIVHPFPQARMPLNSVMRVFEHGERVRELKTPAPRGPSVIFYLLDIVFTVYFFLRTRTRIDLFIGVDNLNAFAGLCLRRMGLVKAVAFYVIDYVPQRFENHALNDIYHWIDKFCCYHVDCIWNVSAAMMEARRTKWRSLDGCAPSLVVPLGCNFERIERLPITMINRHDVVFLGTLAPEQGVNWLLETWSIIRARVPDANLVIVGGGEQEEALKQQANRLGIESSVKFLGFVPDDVEVERTLAKCGVGVAPYAADEASFKRYADPGKVKLYLAAGLPVVITNVPPIAQVIHEAEAGFAINHEDGELTEAIVTLLTQDDIYERYRANAIQFAARFSWNRIFGEALSQTLRLARLDRSL